MNKGKTFFVFACFLAITFFRADAASIKDKSLPVVGPVQGLNARQAEAGGCTFSEEGKEGYVFESNESDSSGGAWVNINGRDVKLETSNRHIQQETIPIPTDFKADDIEVTLKLEQISHGEAGDSYKGQMEVTIHGRKQVLQIDGGCGC